MPFIQQFGLIDLLRAIEKIIAGLIVALAAEIAAHMSLMCHTGHTFNPKCRCYI
jgi:hypothetical protein